MRVNSTLRPRLRLYVAGVTVAGAIALGHSLLALYSDPPPGTWLYLAALTLFSGYFTVKVPSVPARISVSETFVLTAVLLFGTAAGTLIVALDGFLMSILRPRRRLHRVLFNTAEPVFSMWLACRLFTHLGGSSGISSTAIGVSSQIVPLFALAVVYFLVNSWLTAFAVSFETRTPAPTVWRQHFLFLGLNYVGGASVALLLWRNTPELDLGALKLVLPVVLPLLVISYLTFKGALGRVQDARDHITQLNGLYLSTLETLAMAIDAKDQITHGHIRRVQSCAIRLARELGIHDDSVIQAMEAAALLHDIGKIGVPEHILNKPGKLTPAEFDRMKLHASIGAELVSTIHFRELVVPIVRHHHENWDGTGYPDGLAGTNIPIGARILAVVDCYDALTSDRPYRPKLGQEEAVRILVARRSTMYDPLVVDAFLRIHEEVFADAVEPEPEKPAVAKLSQLSKVPVEALLSMVPQEHQGTHTSEQLLELCDLAASLSGHVSLADTTEFVWKHLSRVVPATTCVFFIYQRDSDQLAALHVYGEGQKRIFGHRIQVGGCVSGWVAVNQRTIINADAALDLGERVKEMAPPLLSCLSTPLVLEGSLLGVLTLYSTAPIAFSEDHRRLIEVACRQITKAIADALEFDASRASRFRDQITGLPNLRRLQQFTDGIDALREQIGYPVAFVLVDVQGLDAMNRAYGRQMGPLALGHVTQVLRSTLRAADVLFKTGDSEFVVLLTRTDAATAESIAERMIESVRQEPLVLADGTEFNICVTAGVGLLPFDGHSREEALARARSRTGTPRRSVLDHLPTVH